MCLLRHNYFLMFSLIFLASSRDSHQHEDIYQPQNTENGFLIPNKIRLDRSILETNPTDEIHSTVEKRALTDACLTAHCNKCNRIKQTCVGCDTGYELKNSVCKEIKIDTNQENTNSRFSIYILAIFFTLLLVSIACCLLAMHLKKKIEANPFVEAPTQIYTDIRSIANISVNPEVNGEGLSVRELMENDFPHINEDNVGQISGRNLSSRKGSFDQINFDKVFVRIHDDEKSFNQECAICSDKLKFTDYIRKDSCVHYFHEGCIMDKVILSGYTVCPLNGELTEGNSNMNA
ncbi:hypothetical protein SteCoe_18077 [Stentor coeruleus]|uniref:RING-type domain-containing protein n=1 Tax=Stentor coeruleus TaxID=5963 RepID=A0A1R2BXD8_9CILI|nr:hypothetical protein SteCoe_18077 [Stentor coeruleus]